MSGYGIDDVPHLDLNRDEQASLDAHDAEQASLMAEAVIQVAEDDQIIGPISKLKAHQGTGLFHRAFSVLLFNTKGEMLLQQRSGEKVTFPNVWANAVVRIRFTALMRWMSKMPWVSNGLQCVSWNKN